jgi:hypothetical protein
MRSGRDIPGRGGPGDTDPPAPAGFPADAVKPSLVGIVSTMLAAWTVGLTLRLMSTPRALIVAVYYLVVFTGLIGTGDDRLGQLIAAHRVRITIDPGIEFRV